MPSLLECEIYAPNRALKIPTIEQKSSVHGMYAMFC